MSSLNQALNFFDTKNGVPIKSSVISHAKPVYAVTFSPDSDGLKIVSGSYDLTLCLWHGSSGHAIGLPFKGHYGWVNSVVFSPDGKKIVSGSNDHTVHLWGVSTGRTIGSPFTGHTKQVNSVAFLPNGKKIVSGSYDYTIRLWDVATNQTFQRPLWLGGFCGILDKIASGSGDTDLFLWIHGLDRPLDHL